MSAIDFRLRAYPDQTRNLNPHKAARVAMILYNQRYAAQRGGSMDFWDSLRAGERETCRRLVKEIENAPEESAQREEG